MTKRDKAKTHGIVARVESSMDPRVHNVIGPSLKAEKNNPASELFPEIVCTQIELINLLLDDLDDPNLGERAAHIKLVKDRTQALGKAYGKLINNLQKGFELAEWYISDVKAALPDAHIGDPTPEQAESEKMSKYFRSKVHEATKKLKLNSNDNPPPFSGRR